VKCLTIALTTLALLLSPAVAAADPVVPQPDTSCPANYSGVMTWPPDAKLPLVCQDGLWHTVTTPQPPNDRWLSFGPPMALHGEGRRNPDVASGDWAATPQDSASRCRAEQSTVVSPGVISPSQVTEGQPGKPLDVQLAPRLFDLQLSGYCLWERII
jgi:hypothetical protein